MQLANFETCKLLHLGGRPLFYDEDGLYDVVAAGDVVVDANACIGYHTLSLARKVTEKGYVVAFEAHQFLFNTLCGNLALNHVTHVQPFNRMVGPHSIGYCCDINFNDCVDWLDLGPATMINYKDRKERIHDKPVCSITIDSLNLSMLSLIRAPYRLTEVLYSAKSTIDRLKPAIVTLDSEENRKTLERYSYKMDKKDNRSARFVFAENTDECSDFTEVH